MPRYLMSPQDMTDLLAYMRRLETDLDPGLNDAVIRVGTVLPLRGPRRPLGETMLTALRGAFAKVNAGGGIHDRRIELSLSRKNVGRHVTSPTCIVYGEDAKTAKVEPDLIKQHVEMLRELIIESPSLSFKKKDDTN